MDFWQIDGFEHGVVASGVSGVYDAIIGSPTIVTSPVRSDLRSIKFNPAGAAQLVRYVTPAATRQATQSFAVRFTTADGLPAANCTLASFANASGPGQLRYRSTTGRFCVAVNNLGIVNIGPATVVVDTWYWIDLAFDSSGATALMSGIVDNGAVGVSSRAQAADDITSFNLGTAEANTYVSYNDDWLMSLDIADFPLREHHIESLILTSDGTHNIATAGDFDSFTGTAFSNATTNGHTFIGHRPLQIANTADQVIRQDLGAVTDYMEFLFENLASGTGVPDGVRGYASVIESTTGSSNGEVRLLLSDNTEVLTTGSVSAIDDTDNIDNAVIDIFRRMAIPPSGGWTRTKVNGLKTRLGYGDGVPDINFVDLMVEVALLDVTLATPAKVSAVAAFATPTILRGSAPSPDPVTGQAAIPAPSPQGAAHATPSKVSGVTAIPTPGVAVGGQATAQPARVAAQAAVRTPRITTGSPSSSTYAHGYGGYESEPEITEPPPTPPPPPPHIPATTPALRIRVDWVNDINPKLSEMPVPRWVDITARVRTPDGASVHRGRQRALDRNEAGNAVITVGDVDRALDPDNADSPYWPYVTPDRRIQAQAVFPDYSEAFTMCDSQVGGTDIVGGGDTSKYVSFFDGIIDSYAYTYPGPGKDAKVTMRCTDLFAAMSRDTVGVVVPAGYAEDALNYLLNQRAYTGRVAGALGTESSPDRDIPEVVFLEEAVLASVTYNGSLLEALQQTEISGGGNFFISRDGKPTYRPPSWIDRSADTRKRWALDAERYHDVEFTYDETLIYNNIRVTNLDGTLAAIAVDAASDARHPGRPPLEIATSLAVQADLQQRADELLANYHEPQKAVTLLDLSNLVDDWEMVLTCELWDRIVLEVLLPNGDLITQPSLIQGIEIITSNHRDWKVQFWLSIPTFRNLLSVADSGFEDATVGGWVAGSNSAISATATMFSRHFFHHRGGGDGVGVSQVVPVDAAEGSWVLWADAISAGNLSAFGPVIPVEARRNYLIRAKVRVAAYNAADVPSTDTIRDIQMQVDWYDEDDIYLSTDLGVSIPVLQGQWSLVELSTRAPNGAATALIRILSEGINTAGFYVDDVLFTRIV